MATRPDLEGDCTYSPEFFHRTDPLVYNHTQRVRTGSQETAYTKPINFAEYGVENPATARVLVGLVEMGVMTARGLMAGIEAHRLFKSEEPTNAEKVSLESFFWTITLNPNEIENIRNNINLSHRFYSGEIARNYPLTNLFSFLNDLTKETEQEKVIHALDTFFDLYAGGRMQILHLAEKIFRGEMQEAEKIGQRPDIHEIYGSSLDKFDEMYGRDSVQYKDFIKRFRTFEAAWRSIGSIPEMNEEIIFTTFQGEVKSGFYNLLQMFQGHNNSSDALIRANRMHGRARRIVIDVTTGQVIIDLHSSSVSYKFRLRTGEEVLLYKAGGCPFFSTGWEEV